MTQLNFQKAHRQCLHRANGVGLFYGVWRLGGLVALELQVFWGEVLFWRFTPSEQLLHRARVALGGTHRVWDPWVGGRSTTPF